MPDDNKKQQNFEVTSNLERKLKNWEKNKNLTKRPRTTEIIRLRKSEDIYKTTKTKMTLLEKEVDGLKK